MDVTRLYNFIIKKCTDEQGVEAERALSVTAGAAGFLVLEKCLLLHKSIQVAPGKAVILEGVEKGLDSAIETLLRAASGYSIDPNPESGWIGMPLSSDALRKHILHFNQHHLVELKGELKSAGFSHDLYIPSLLSLSCLLLTQVKGSVVPESEGKRIISWSLQCGAKTMPLLP